MRVLTTANLDELRDLRSRHEFFWLDLDNPLDELLDGVGEILKLHELALEDTREFGQRPKIDTYEDQLLLVYFGAGIDEAGRPGAVEVHLHVSPYFVLSVHRLECQQFEVVRDQLERRPPDDEQSLVYRVIDGLTDSILDVLEQVADQVDDYEREIFRHPRARDRDRMAQLRRTLGSLRRVLVIQRQVFERAVDQLIALVGGDEDTRTYYRDVGDHLWRAIDEIEASRDSLQGMLDTYSNEVQERLTIVATIFLPLTVITGFFGMNFSWLISHIGATWAFWGLGVGGLVFSALSITLWLLRSGLYQGPGRR